MKKILVLASLFNVVILFTFLGCQDRTELTAPVVNTGSASLATYVSIGNSITSGYQSSSLYADAQQYSFPNLIAGQVGANFVQPLIGNPGIGGRIDIKSINLSTGAVVLYTNPVSGGAPLNSGYAMPFNNLGVPGAVLADVLDTASFASKAAAPRSNPYFSIVLRSSSLGNSILAQAVNLHPTFMTLWIGNNDVLGYATSGGVQGTVTIGGVAYPTPASAFTALYNQLIGAIATQLPNTKVAVGNIPNVQAIPFFTTVGPSLAASLTKAGVPAIYYQKNNYSVSVTTTSDLSTFKTLITLKGSTYAPLIGTVTGQFYRDFGINPALLGVDTTKPFGVTSQNPFPNLLVLDADEQVIVNQAVSDFNAAISAAISGKSNFVLVDMNSVFNTIRSHDAAGSVYDGVTLRTSYITGGLFSLDGVHPTNQGAGVLANEFIKKINSAFGASIPLVNVANLPSSIKYAKMVQFNSIGLPIVPNGTFDNILF